MASDRDEVQRAAFRATVAPLDQERFIFVDETSPSLAMTRSSARAPRGQRAYGVVPRNHGQNVSGIGALGRQGMGAALSVEGAVDTDVFEVFVRQVLVPALTPGAVVLLDNLHVHHASCGSGAGPMPALLLARLLADRAVWVEGENLPARRGRPDAPPSGDRPEERFTRHSP